MTLDEIDTAIMEIVSKRGKANISQIVEDLSRDYNINILRSRVRNHAESLCRYDFLKKKVGKILSRRQSQYEYEVSQ